MWVKPELAALFFYVEEIWSWDKEENQPVNHFQVSSNGENKKHHLLSTYYVPDTLCIFADLKYFSQQPCSISLKTDT